jgi:hypothetical protein
MASTRLEIPYRIAYLFNVSALPFNLKATFTFTSFIK